jgi:MraZ protein
VARTVLFTGQHDRQLDDKGRLALPAGYRTNFGESCYVVKGSEKCLEVFLRQDFEAEAERLHERVQRGEMGREEQRTKMASANLVNVDRQGRINIDERLRAYAELPQSSAVVVSGNYDRLEIWEPDRFGRMSEAGDTRMAGAAE